MFVRCQRILQRLVYVDSVRRTPRRALPIGAGLLLLLLAGCSEINLPAQIPPTPTPLVFTPLDDAVANGLPTSGAQVTTVGYVIVDAQGTRLVDGLSFSADQTPRPLSGSDEQIWLSIDGERALRTSLRAAGQVKYALVVVRGRLEGPGAYGPNGRYGYQIGDPRLQPAALQETTVAALLDKPAAHEGRILRVVGVLLAHAELALLVDHISVGGLPEPGARQVKLRTPLRDAALLERLKRAAGAVRFGQVQVEGFWRGGVLVPLAILPIS